MASKLTSRQLVVDACVLRAAGETEHPVSSRCRQTLNHILAICHHAVLDDRLRDEWQRHASRRAKKWWGTMQRRGKIDKANAYKAAIRFAGTTIEDREVIEKDRILIDSSYKTGKIIITLDSALKDALRRTDNKRFLDEIRWFNPVSEAGNYLETL